MNPPARRDKRPTLTLKGDEFTPEFRSLLNKAAKKAGKTQAEFAAETLAAAARRVLTGTPEDNPTDNPAPPPAVIQHLEERQAAADAKLDEAARAIAALADQVQALTAAQRRGLWARLFGR